jgi:hypothetical protein
VFYSSSHYDVSLENYFLACHLTRWGQHDCKGAAIRRRPFAFGSGLMDLANFTFNMLYILKVRER